VQPSGDAARHFRAPAQDAATCPQVDILRIEGSLFFGAVEHVQDELEAAHHARPDVRHVLLVMSGVNFIDASGAAMLGQFAQVLRAAGVTLSLCNVKAGVLEVLQRADQLQAIGPDHVFHTKDAALRAIYRTLDATVCAGCAARIFHECQVTLPDGSLRDPPRPELALVPPLR
jgi:SulP family sulfate permease